MLHSSYLIIRYLFVSSKRKKIIGEKVKQKKNSKTKCKNGK